MYTFFIVLIIVASLLLVVMVLLQNSKGGGMTATFIGGNQFGGVAQTNKFLEKGTWTLAMAILLLSIMASISLPDQEKVQKESEIKDFIENYTVPQVPQEGITPTPAN